MLECAEELRQERQEKAAAILQRALELNPSYANTYYLLGRLSVQKKDDQQAEYYFERACALNPKHSSAYYQMSRIALRRGERERAAELTRAVQELRSEFRQRERETFSELVQESLRGSSGRILVSKSKR